MSQSIIQSPRRQSWTSLYIKMSEANFHETFNEGDVQANSMH